MFTREMAAAKAVQTLQTGEVIYSSHYAAGLISGKLASGSSAVASFFMDQTGSLRTADCPASAAATSPEFTK